MRAVKLAGVLLYVVNANWDRGQPGWWGAQWLVRRWVALGDLPQSNFPRQRCSCRMHNSVHKYLYADATPAAADDD